MQTRMRRPGPLKISCPRNPLMWKTPTTTKVSDAFVDTAVTVGKRATRLNFGTVWAKENKN